MNSPLDTAVADYQTRMRRRRKRRGRNAFMRKKSVQYHNTIHNFECHLKWSPINMNEGEREEREGKRGRERGEREQHTH